MGGSGADDLLRRSNFFGFADAGEDDEADTLHFAGTATSATISLGSGNDSVFLSGGIAGSGEVDLGVGDDTVQVTGDLAKTSVFGADGADFVTVSGELGTSTIKGGSGADTIMISDGDTSSNIASNTGDDSISVGLIKQAAIFGLVPVTTLFVTTLSSGVVGGQRVLTLLWHKTVSADIQLAVKDEGSTQNDTLSVSGLVMPQLFFR